MDYIEVSEFTGVRATVVDYRRAGSPLTFVIFPMCHIGEPRYYAEVTERLRSCDLIIAEGVRGRSANAAALTGTYEPAARSTRLGLVVQDIDYAAVGVPLVTPDFTGPEFDASWKRRVPWWQTVGARVAGPAFGLWMQHFATRRSIAEAIEAGDIRTLDVLEAEALVEGIVDVVQDQRDARLISSIRKVHHERGDEPLRVAVVWGANHMRAVTDELYALGYRGRDAERVTIFLLDEE